MLQTVLISSSMCNECVCVFTMGVNEGKGKSEHMIYASSLLFVQNALYDIQTCVHDACFFFKKRRNNNNFFAPYLCTQCFKSASGKE